MKKINIIIPAFKAQDTIDRTLASIATQSIVNDIVGDDTYIYVCGDFDTVVKLLKSTLGLVATGDTLVRNGEVMVNDDTYVYAGGTNDSIVKFKKSDMTKVSQSASMSDTIYSITQDYLHIYAGNRQGLIHQYLKSDMSTVDTAIYTTGIDAKAMITK